jgi:hypothetical protein
VHAAQVRLRKKAEKQLQKANETIGKLDSRCDAHVMRVEDIMCAINDWNVGYTWRAISVRHACHDRRCSCTELEKGMEELHMQLKVAREGAGLLNTIARIRSTEIDPAARAVGFDAVINRVDKAVSDITGKSATKQSPKVQRNSKATGSVT